MIEWTKVYYRKIRNPFILFCVENNISSNTITIFNHIITLTFGCFFFSRGKYWGWILGLGVCLINGFLDYLDGDVAKAKNKTSALGEWLDSGFDVIVQNAVMGAIAIGCYKMGLSLVLIIIFFISHSAINYVSFVFNERFGFSSKEGNEVFRKGMRKKLNEVNVLFEAIIDPTTNFWP